jgi:hypothetical protein
MTENCYKQAGACVPWSITGWCNSIWFLSSLQHVVFISWAAEWVLACHSNWCPYVWFYCYLTRTTPTILQDKTECWHLVSPVVLSEHSWGGALFISCSKIDPTQFPQFCVDLEHSYRSGEGFCTYIPLLLVSFSYSSPFCFSCLVSLVICFSLGFVELASLMAESSWSLLIWWQKLSMLVTVWQWHPPIAMNCQQECGCYSSWQEKVGSSFGRNYIALLYLKVF